MSEKLSDRLWNYGDVALARMAEALETEVERLRKALEDIAQGNAGITDEVLEGGQSAVTSHMWTYSQERARAALARRQNDE